MLQKCNHANNLYTAAKKLSFTYLKAARKMDWQQSEGQLVKADTTAKLKQEINCLFFSNFYIQFSGFHCAQKVWSCLTPITAAKKLSFTCLKAARKMDWQPAGGQLVKVDTAAKLKREQVLYCALKSALFCDGSGAAVGLLAPAVSLIWLEKRSFPN